MITIKYLNDIYKRKDLLIYLVTSNLKAQHRNTFLGYFWWLLDPLLGITIYYFLVSVLFKRGGSDYGSYLVIGMVVWRWLESTINTAERSIHSQAGLITQIYLPKILFPIGATLSQLVNFGFGLVIISVFLIFFKIIPGPNLFWLPFIMTVQLFFMTAIAFPLAFLGVKVRDFDNIVKHIMRLWFFASPVIWPESIFPKKLLWLVGVNPMTQFLRSYRDIFLHNQAPDFFALLSIGSLSLLVSVLVLFYYSRNEHKIIKLL